MKLTFVLIPLLAGLGLACDDLRGQQPEIQARGWLGDDKLAAELARPGLQPLVVGYLPPDRPELAKNLGRLQQQFAARAAFIGLSSGDARQVRECLGDEPDFPVGFGDDSELCACKADAYILDPGRRVVWQGRAEQLCAPVIEEHLGHSKPLPNEYPASRDFRKVVRELRRERLGAAWELCLSIEADARASDWERETAAEVVAAVEDQAAALAAQADLRIAEGHYRQAAELLDVLRRRFEGLETADDAARTLKAWSQDPEVCRAVEVDLDPLLARARVHEEHGCWAEAAACYEQAAAQLGQGAQADACREQAEIQPRGSGQAKQGPRQALNRVAARPVAHTPGFRLDGSGTRRYNARTPATLEPRWTSPSRRACKRCSTRSPSS